MKPPTPAQSAKRKEENKNAEEESDISICCFVGGWSSGSPNLNGNKFNFAENIFWNAMLCWELVNCDHGKSKRNLKNVLDCLRIMPTLKQRKNKTQFIYVIHSRCAAHRAGEALEMICPNKHNPFLSFVYYSFNFNFCSVLFCVCLSFRSGSWDFRMGTRQKNLRKVKSKCNELHSFRRIDEVPPWMGSNLVFSSSSSSLCVASWNGKHEFPSCRIRTFPSHRSQRSPCDTEECQMQWGANATAQTDIVVDIVVHTIAYIANFILIVWLYGPYGVLLAMKDEATIFRLLGLGYRKCVHRLNTTGSSLSRKKSIYYSFF